MNTLGNILDNVLNKKGADWAIYYFNVIDDTLGTLLNYVLENMQRTIYYMMSWIIDNAVFEHVFGNQLDNGFASHTGTYDLIFKIAAGSLVGKEVTLPSLSMLPDVFDILFQTWTIAVFVSFSILNSQIPDLSYLPPVSSQLSPVSLQLTDVSSKLLELSHLRSK